MEAKQTKLELALQQELLQNAQHAFASLEQAGHLELSPEATIIQARYGPLFTDEEINTCLTLLLEAGYF